MFEKRHFETPHQGVLPNMACVISSVTLFLLFAEYAVFDTHYESQ
jgi:hypothetical protein